MTGRKRKRTWGYSGGRQSKRPKAVSLPTLPDEVLEHILSFLDVNYLQTARYVCRAWNREASRVMRGRVISIMCKPKNFAQHLALKRKSATLGLPTGHLQEIEVRCPESRGLDMKKALFNHSLQPSVTQLEVAPASARETIACSCMLRSCASTLTCIDISHLDSKLQFLMSLFPVHTFPYLRFLHISLSIPEVDQTDDDSHKHRSISDLIQKLLKGSPNLKSLVTSGGHEPLKTKPDGRRVNFLQIEHLDIHATSFVMEEILQQPQVPALKSLTLSFAYGLNSATICNILRRFASTLEFLELDRHFESLRGWKDNFPHMPRLRSLVASTDVRLGDKWLKKTPALRELRIGDLLMYHIPRNVDGFPPLVHLESLSVHRVILPETELTQGQRFEVFQRIFPNVKRWCCRQCCRQLVQFAVTKTARAMDFVIEELECIKIGNGFPGGRFKGLRRLVIRRPLKPNVISEEEFLKKLKRNKRWLPDLREVSLKDYGWYSAY